MELSLSLVISLVVAIWTITKFFIDRKANKNKLTAETDNLNISSSTLIMQQMREELARQDEKLKELKVEIELLKGQEKLHFLEKVRLEEKIQKLTSENESLRIMVEENKVSYTLKISDLNESIAKLTGELKLYKTKHNVKQNK